MLTVRYRATDGRRTFTLPDSQPCRLLPQRQASAARVCWMRVRGNTRYILCRLLNWSAVMEAKLNVKVRCFNSWNKLAAFFRQFNDSISS